MNWTREPMVHFLALGALLFALYAALGGSAPPAPGATTIVITPELVENFRVSFARSGDGAAPTAAQLQALVDEFVREEILYREALALGLDQGNTVVRRELRQKMEFFNEDAAGAPTPTDAELEDFVAAQPALFQGTGGRVPPLDEIRDLAAAAWLAARRQAARDAAYAELRKNYTVQIAPAPAPAP